MPPSGRGGGSMGGGFHGGGGGFHSSGGPSRHSSGSMRGSSGGGGLFGGGGFFGGPSRPSGPSRRPSGGPSMVPPPPRPRYNQPHFHSSFIPLLFYCAAHDYRYYDKSYTDPETGTYYEKGYYDENGKHYDNVVMKENGNCKTHVVCEYCGTSTVVEWKEGEIPTCPSCGAPLSEQLRQAATDSSNSQSGYADSYNRGAAASSSRQSGLGKIIFFGILAIIVISFFVVMNTQHERDSGYYSDGRAEIQVEDSIYVEALGRECSYQEDYDCYYDEETDCYFYYDDQSRTPDWLYWYEGISSDFEDSGWMEYVADEDQWYIEYQYGKWEKLPDKYDTSNLWHMEE